MNYRHAYHAGNFADVFKHAILVGLLEALKAKRKPFCYIETHAGAGRYDLRGEEARKTQEAAAGILRLLPRTRLPAALHIYLNMVRSLNARGGDRDVASYPGSPLLAQLALRPGDKAILCELQPQPAAELRTLFRDQPQVHVHQRDGYEALPALVPPTPRRGLVLIDPPYEHQVEDFPRIRQALEAALARWPTGCYAIWYPIKLRASVEPFKRWLRGLVGHKVLDAELLLHPDNSSLRLNGTGMAIVNPPWRFEQVLEDLLEALASELAQSRFSQHRVEWLASGRAKAPL
ncbi:MAG TPA: 23S rRNA (adenine(2030)-N(6))-methyltransferase RlmJ [Rhodanobacteraceae bacterium]|nr:23S rRNA (adenine(2030)-N(6))-methyltransferase RlmJ [Rhodanobacteraceae bacterium]